MFSLGLLEARSGLPISVNCRAYFSVQFMTICAALKCKCAVVKVSLCSLKFNVLLISRLKSSKFKFTVTVAFTG